MKLPLLMLPPNTWGVHEMKFGYKDAKIQHECTGNRLQSQVNEILSIRSVREGREGGGR